MYEFYISYSMPSNYLGKHKVFLVSLHNTCLLNASLIYEKPGHLCICRCSNTRVLKADPQVAQKGWACLRQVGTRGSLQVIGACPPRWLWDPGLFFLSFPSDHAPSEHSRHSMLLARRSPHNGTYYSLTRISNSEPKQTLSFVNWLRHVFVKSGGQLTD